MKHHVGCVVLIPVPVKSRRHVQPLYDFHVDLLLSSFFRSASPQAGSNFEDIARFWLKHTIGDGSGIRAYDPERASSTDPFQQHRPDTAAASGGWTPSSGPTP